MAKPTPTADKLKEDVSNLMQGYTRILKLCYDALAPEATPAKRKEVRDALKTYLEERGDGDGMAKPKSGS